MDIKLDQTQVATATLSINGTSYSVAQLVRVFERAEALDPEDSIDMLSLTPGTRNPLSCNGIKTISGFKKALWEEVSEYLPESSKIEIVHRLWTSCIEVHESFPTWDVYREIVRLKDLPGMWVDIWDEVDAIYWSSVDNETSDDDIKAANIQYIPWSAFEEELSEEYGEQLLIALKTYGFAPPEGAPNIGV